MAQKSLVELEQLRNSRFYDDTKTLGPAAESGVTFSDDLDYVLSQIKQLHGETNWYDTPDASLAELSAMSGTLHGLISNNETDIAELQAYSGVLHNMISANETDIAELQAYSGVLHNMISANETDIAELQAYSGVLHNMITVNEGDIAELQAYSGVLHNMITVNEGDIAELQAYSGVLHNMISTNETDIAELQAYSGVLHNMISANEVDISQINTFIGRADGESNPVYSSTTYVTQSGSLEQAVGELDAALLAVSGIIVSSDEWQEVYDNGNGILNVGAGGSPKADADIRIADSGVWAFTDASGVTNIMEVYNDQVLIRSLGERVYEELGGVRAANTTFSIPGSKSYTLDSAGRNLRVYRNGQLLLPGAGNDYEEVSTTQIKNLDAWRPNEVIQYVILG